MLGNDQTGCEARWTRQRSSGDLTGHITKRQSQLHINESQRYQQTSTENNIPSTSSKLTILSHKQSYTKKIQRYYHSLHWATIDSLQAIPRVVSINPIQTSVILFTDQALTCRTVSLSGCERNGRQRKPCFLPETTEEWLLWCCFLKEITSLYNNWH